MVLTFLYRKTQRMTRLKPDKFRMNFDPSQSLSPWQIESITYAQILSTPLCSFLLISTAFYSFLLLSAPFFSFLLLSILFCSLFFLFFVRFSFSAFLLKDKKCPLSLSIYTTGIRKQRSIKSRTLIFY